MDIKNRFWEIDTLRGIAIIMMVIYHIIYDINFFKVYEINLESPLIILFLYPIGTIFLLLVGISLTLSYSRVEKKYSNQKLIKKFVFRGLKIFCLGLIITIITYFYLDRGFVVFGILHCIGISIIVSYPLLRYRFLNLFLGLVFILFGIFLRLFSFDFNYLLWLGFIPENFYTVDYFPLLPWLGVVLIGIFLGNILYPNYTRKYDLDDYSDIRIVKFLSFLGRYSLFIYFIHQPIIIGFIYLLKP